MGSYQSQGGMFTLRPAGLCVIETWPHPFGDVEGSLGVVLATIPFL